MPKVSIIIPVYNTSKYLQDCLDSIMNQSLKDLEIICINDASTDTSLDILKENMQKDNRIKIINNKTNLYAGPSRNSGLVVAEGEYIYFMDSDDILKLDTLQKCIEILDKDKDIDFCIFHKILLNEAKHSTMLMNTMYTPTLGKNMNRAIYTAEYLEDILRVEVPAWLKIYRKDFLLNNNILFDDLKCANDRYFFFQTVFKSKKIYLLDEYLIIHRINVPNSLVKKRFENFYCMYKSYEETNLLVKDENTRIKNIIIDLTLKDIFTFYNKATRDEQKKILGDLKKFLKSLRFPDRITLYKNYSWYNQYRSIANSSMIQKIFSINNEKIHKVITIFGLKIKIKNKRKELLNKIDILQEKVNKLRNNERNNAKLINILNNNLEEMKKDNEKLIKALNKNLDMVKKHTNEMKKDFEYKLCKYIPEDKRFEYLKDWYFNKTGEVLHLDNPQTFNEKIQWMKLYDSTPLKTRLADKYLVREWIKEKIGEEYLIPLLGVWENFDDIDFDKLPNQFVLKANHGSGWNVIVKDKNSFNKKDAKSKFDKWLHTNYAYVAGCEMHYKDIKPLIIAEKYLETEENDLQDYKFLCFNGEVKYIWVDKDRYTNHKRNLFDPSWNVLQEKISESHVYDNWSPCPKPKNLDKMLEFATLLSKDINFVRVDFYEHENKLYFGEMTFTSASGSHIFSPSTFNLQLGELIQITQNK